MKQIEKSGLLLLGIAFSVSVHAQNINQFFESRETSSIEKLYLHTDREFYFPGDTLWFMGYNVDGQTHKPLQNHCNLYVELINESGSILIKELFEMKDGLCQGYLSLRNNSLFEGNYLFRAYTDYSRAYGEDAVLQKPVRISGYKPDTDIAQSFKKDAADENIQVGFYPEGGFLLAGVLNRVAFKATDKNGGEVDLRGVVVDETGQEAARFSTLYKGMGMFYFIPQPQRHYVVKIEEYPSLKLDFPEIREKGSKLMVTASNKKSIFLGIVTSVKK